MRFAFSVRRKLCAVLNWGYIVYRVWFDLDSKNKNVFFFSPVFKSMHLCTTIGNVCVSHNGTEHGDTPVDCRDVAPRRAVRTQCFLIGFLCILIRTVFFVTSEFRRKTTGWCFYTARYRKYEKNWNGVEKKRDHFIISRCNCEGQR